MTCARCKFPMTVRGNNREMFFQCPICDRRVGGITLEAPPRKRFEGKLLGRLCTGVIANARLFTLGLVREPSDRQQWGRKRAG